MGKRAKKKVQSSPAKSLAGVRSSSGSSTTTNSSLAESVALLVNASALEAGCPHGANLDKLRSQLEKAITLQCLECAKLRSGGPSFKERRVKGKVVKKKGPSLAMPGHDDVNPSRKLWICLSCGHVGCGVGDICHETGERKVAEVANQGLVGRGHAWQHWLQLKHPLVMFCGERLFCWCFECAAAHNDNSSESVSVEQIEKDTQVSKPLSRLMILKESARMVQEKLSRKATNIKKEQATSNGHGHSNGVVVESGGEIQQPNPPRNGVFENGDSVLDQRVMKGLINLGNTCFFNSVMQNLLGVDMLRRHFSLDSSSQEGPLTSSLRKFYREISIEEQLVANGSSSLEAAAKRISRTRGGWNCVGGTFYPKSLFGAICAKSPRFKGFQEQDSHELLRCLLDGLHTEEESSRSVGTKDSEKTRLQDSVSVPNSEEQQADTVGAVKRSHYAETFVEKVFGGQLSSTVSCCECGYSSVVYEPFLDLSLPIPAKQSVKKSTALENGEQNKTQRVQGKKASKSTCDHGEGSWAGPSNTDVDDSTPLLLLDSSQSSMPLLLLPPPPKEANADRDLWEDSGWLDYLGDEPSLDLVSNMQPHFASDLSVDKQPLRLEGQNGVRSSPKIVSNYSDATNVWVEARQNGKSLCNNGCVSSDQMLDLELASEPLMGLQWDNNGVSGVKQDRILANISHPQTNGNSTIKDSPLGNCFKINHTLAGKVEGLHSNGKLVEPSDGTLLVPQSISGTVILEAGESQYSPETEGSLEGVASLFEEECTNSEPVYGPFPLNQELGGADQNGVLDEIGLDDVLDLSKFGNEGKEEWLVSVEDLPDKNGFSHESNVAMSLEGCLQIFTRSELLSGENAWACENCNKILQDKLGMPPTNQASLAVIQKHSATRSNGKVRADPMGKNVESVHHHGSKNSQKILKECGVGIEPGSNMSIAGNGSMACTSSEMQENGEPESMRAWTPEPSGTFPFAGVDVSSSRIHVWHDAESKPMEVQANGNRIGKCEAQEKFLGPPETRAYSGNVGCSVCSQSCNSEDKSGPSFQMSRLEDKNANDVSHSSECDPIERVEDIPVQYSQEDREELLSEKLKVSNSVNTGSRGVDGRSVLQPTASSAEPSRRETGVVVAKPVKLKKCRSKKALVETKVVKQDATKRFSISKAPPVLTIQLKRFAQDLRGRLSKLSGHVTFQEWLDLQPFLDQRHGNPQSCKYRLIGTVEHTGTLKGGHYVAYVRGPPSTGRKDDIEINASGSSWYYICDSHVRLTTLEAVLQSEAYLLFYERCQ